MVNVWDPFKDISKIRKQVNKRFGGLLGNYKKPYSNITQNPKKVIINIELPGIKKKNIFVDITDSKLIVKADDTSRKVKKGKDEYSEETSYSGFYRAITLPYGVDILKADAKFNDKVLKIKIPKRATSRSVRVK